MRDLIVILLVASSIAFFCLIVSIITSDKKLKHRDELKIGIIGSAIFMFISWLVVYIANIHPFIKPEFKKERKPDYYLD